MTKPILQSSCWLNMWDCISLPCRSLANNLIKDLQNVEMRNSRCWWWKDCDHPLYVCPSVLCTSQVTPWLANFQGKTSQFVQPFFAFQALQSQYHLCESFLHPIQFNDPLPTRTAHNTLVSPTILAVITWHNMHLLYSKPPSVPNTTFTSVYLCLHFQGKYVSVPELCKL